MVIVMVPTAIMERSPTPGIGGFPVPSMIAVNPASVGVVRFPTDIDHRCRGSPNRTIGANLDPLTIGFELVIEIVVVNNLRRWRRGNGFDRRTRCPSVPF